MHFIHCWLVSLSVHSAESEAGVVAMNPVHFIHCWLVSLSVHPAEFKAGVVTMNPVGTAARAQCQAHSKSYKYRLLPRMAMWTQAHEDNVSQTVTRAPLLSL